MALSEDQSSGLIPASGEVGLNKPDDYSSARTDTALPQRMLPKLARLDVILTEVPASDFAPLGLQVSLRMSH